MKINYRIAIISTKLLFLQKNDLRQDSMSEKEMNSYRFVSGQEPTDEMLSQLMKEVAEEANSENQKATEAHFSQMRRNIVVKREKWSERINSIVNG